MTALALDHLVVLAPDLATGRAWAENRLGVSPGGGGAHPAMGTHNLLWSMGGVYLEVIAADPSAPEPPEAAPRWFGLDDPETKARLERDGPFLATWAVSTAGLEGFAAAAPLPMRPIARMSRGTLTWEIALAEGAAPPLGGLWPLGLRWPSGRHPTRALPASGLGLMRLTLAGKGSDTVARALPAGLERDRPGFGESDGPPRMEGEIALPSGGTVIL